MRSELKKEIALLLNTAALNKELSIQRIQEGVQNEDFYVTKQKQYAPLITTVKEAQKSINETTLKSQDNNETNLAILGKYLRDREDRLNQSIHELPQLLGLPDVTVKQAENNELGALTLEYLQGLAQRFAYGIQYDDSLKEYFIGHERNYQVTFQGDNIIIHDYNKKKKLEILKPTQGLWEILTRKTWTPGTDGSEFKYITDDDKDKYRRFALKYGLVFRKDGSTRHSNSKTWERFLKPVADLYKDKNKTNKRQTASESQSHLSAASVASSSRSQSTGQQSDEDVFLSPNNSGTHGGGLPNVAKSSYIILPDDNKFLLSKFKGYLSHLHAGHTLDFNEAQHIADRLRQKKILTKGQYEKFTKLFVS
jgi:transcriptional regulator with XRE-family HTH domain